MSTEVLVLYTGGTIGMTQTAQGLAPASGLQGRIERALGDSLNSLPSFEVLEISPLIDSANITPAHWTKLVSILNVHWQDYDGFVILHGTDTMAYTASALSFMLGASPKNIILTGSQIPLGMNRSDATANLQAALSLAVLQPIPDVSLVFNGKLMRGNRIQKVSSGRFEAFHTPNNDLLGELAIHVQLYPERMSEWPSDLRVTNLDDKLVTFQSGAVAVVTLHPSQPISLYQSLLDDKDCHGIILMTYGAGNVPDQNPAFLSFLTEAMLRKKIVVNITQCLHGGVSQGTYATGSMLSSMNVLSGQDMTLEAAFCKLHWLIANGENYHSLLEKWSINYANEFTTK
ncbi:asparaginase [Marinomonas posidonica]|uniref:1-alkyl-2-acetylglycerophosphocholine esterase n=1 Tax=Marinomonas posidonica (strain CECT 7376 / NCIMB 14433 / IVIA-Po-181) TaxID=491952 RepID=F6CXA5_MARPP|nr:asparaginase [Marinomonas posidonica]AEF54458.1 1-alkyl-2-acetylglycerophosphocholine esterase [Marinomonas posidonica IVIA-Po-181]